jgi:hypothetical protein
MRKTAIWLAAAALIGIGGFAAWIVFRQPPETLEGRTTEGAPVPMTMTAPAPTYAWHESRLPGLHARFQYPAGWHPRESQGSSEVYSQVQVFGAEAAQGTGPYLLVRAAPTSQAGGRHPTLDALIHHYRTTAFPGTVFRDEPPVHVAGMTGTALVAAFTLRLPFHSTQAKPVAVTSQRVFAQRGAYLYEFTYHATHAGYPEFLNAFQHLLETFSFLDSAS